MRRLVLATVLLATAAAAVPGGALLPVAGAAPACKHLLVDPAGDADHLGAGDAGRVVEDGRVADLLSADLASDRTALGVVMRVKGRNPEGGTSFLDHAWVLSFSTATERFQVVAEQTRFGGARFALYRVVAGDDVPEDEERPSASASEGVDTVVTGSIDEVRGLVRMKVPVSAFAELGGLGARLTRVRVITWSGNGVHDAAGNGAGTYGSTDFGSTRTAYSVGAKGCA